MEAIIYKQRNLSISSFAGFPELWVEGFNCNTSLKLLLSAECLGVGLCISSHLLLEQASLMMDEQSIHPWVKLNVIRDQFIINLLFLFFGTMVFWFTLSPWDKHFQVLCHPRSVNTAWIIFLKHMKICRKLNDTFSAVCLYLTFCPSVQTLLIRSWQYSTFYMVLGLIYEWLLFEKYVSHYQCDLDIYDL